MFKKVSNQILINNKLTQSKDDLTEKKRNQLPANFADEVLNLELMMEETPVLFESIQKLTDYYQIAIEYYDKIASTRKEIFLRKLDQLFKKPDVKLAVQRNKEKMGNPTKEQKIDSFKSTNFNLACLFLFIIVRQEISNANLQNQNIQNLIVRKETQISQIVNQIQTELSQQEDSIKQRILLKKQQLQKKQQPELTQEQIQQQNQEIKKNSIAMLRLSKIQIDQNLLQNNVEQIIQRNSVRHSNVAQIQRVSNVAKLQQLFQQTKEQQEIKDQKKKSGANAQKLMELFGKVKEEQEDGDSEHESKASSIDENDIKDEYK